MITSCLSPVDLMVGYFLLCGVGLCLVAVFVLKIREII